MTKAITFSTLIILIVGSLVVMACKDKKESLRSSLTITGEKRMDVNPHDINKDWLSPFIRRIYQDKNGTLWFGTNGDGVIRLQDDSLEYFSENEGFGGNAVRGFEEDDEGHLWIGTSGGVTQYDGNTFTNFSEEDGLGSNSVWGILKDKNGIFWVGSRFGVSCFDPKIAMTNKESMFIPFNTNEADTALRAELDQSWVHTIMEDSRSRIWFGTDRGIFIYDPAAQKSGNSLTKLTTADGLSDDRVNCIVEYPTGTFWIATHFGNVCSWDGESFSHVTLEKDEVMGSEVFDIYKDKDNHLWFPVEGFGMYRFDGESFTNFHNSEGLASNAIQSSYQDKEGRLWAGGYGGLFCYDGISFINVTKNGPWDIKVQK